MEMEISSGKADYEQFLTSGDGPNDHRRILG
jgi:hypothetical protein